LFGLYIRHSLLTAQQQLRLAPADFAARAARSDLEAFAPGAIDLDLGFDERYRDHLVMDRLRSS
jgi:hypothetical protein